jgi:hypothetical protein
VVQVVVEPLVYQVVLMAQVPEAQQRQDKATLEVVDSMPMKVVVFLG